MRDVKRLLSPVSATYNDRIIPNTSNRQEVPHPSLVSLARCQCGEVSTAHVGLWFPGFRNAALRQPYVFPCRCLGRTGSDSWIMRPSSCEGHPHAYKAERKYTGVHDPSPLGYHRNRGISVIRPTANGVISNTAASGCILKCRKFMQVHVMDTSAKARDSRQAGPSFSFVYRFSK